MTAWLRARQWCYPRELRIDVGSHEASALSALLGVISGLLAQMERDARRAASPAAAAAPAADAAPSTPPTSGLDKGFVIDVCNNLHRLSRAAAPLLKAAGADGSRAQRNLESLRKALQAKGIEAVDLSGQIYTPDRNDFDPLGEPQPTEGITRLTIVQCDRPLVLLDGKMLQPAKGVVGRPALDAGAAGV